MSTYSSEHFNVARAAFLDTGVHLLADRNITPPDIIAGAVAALGHMIGATCEPEHVDQFLAELTPALKAAACAARACVASEISKTPRR